MLIRNGKMIMDGILKPLRLLARIRSTRAIFYCGGCALLFGSQLCAQDMLLKEYIYLDGRLLAVERQVVTLAAQQPAGDSDKATNIEFALNTHSDNRETILPDSNWRTAMPGNYDGQSIDASHNPVLSRFINPEDRQSRFVVGENVWVHLDAYPRHWKTLGIYAHRNGGNDGGL